MSTFYVATTGSDAAAGGATAPWHTLQHAVDSARPGDTILVESGTYAGCRIGSSGLQGAPITLKADAGARVLVDSPGPNNYHSSDIEVENFGARVTNWVLDGLEVANAPRYGIDLRNTDSVAVQNCKVHNNTVSGIFLAFSDHPLIQGNETYANGEHGIYDSNSGDYPTIRGNYSHDNRDCGIQLNADGTMGGDGIITGALIERNTIVNNGVGGGAAINLDGVQSSTLQNNLLYDNHAGGIVLYRFNGSGGSSNDLVVNNTVVMASGSRSVVSIAVGSTGDTLLNNILYSDTNVAISISQDSLPGFTSDYNAVADRFTTTDGTSLLSLAGWRTATGQDAHSFVSTPAALFVNAAGNDYHLSASSPAVDTGTPSHAPSVDLVGDPRPQGNGYDIGAYERQGTTTPPPGSASFVKVDAATQGSWRGVYGADGYNVIGNAAAYPAYAAVTPAGQSSWTWAASTADVRALQKATNPADRIAATWYAGASFTVDVNVTDGQQHQLSLYLLDWDKQGRSERVDVLDAASGAVLATQTATGFSGGEYLVFNVSGHVTFRFTRLAGPNAVLSGLFFDSAAGGNSASFVKLDAATQGSWRGVYGADGYNVIGNAAAYPAYAAVTPSGQSPYTWAASTADVRALQKPANPADRVAACWYAGSSFTVDVNLTDGRAHQLALYLLDWDKQSRGERVDVLDAASGAVLATQTVTGFSGGEYVVFNVSGHVTFRFTRLAGPNAVLSGLFFG